MRRHVVQLLVMLTLMVGPLVAVIATDTSPQLGLDLQGGISVVLAPKEGSGTETLGQAVNIIRNRIDSLGVAEPEVSRQGDNITVDLPGVKDRQKALDIVGQTAELRFRAVLQHLGDESIAVTTTTTAPTTTTTTVPGATTTTVAGATTTTAAAPTSTTVQRGEVAQATSSTTASTATTATTAPAATPPAEPTTTTTVPQLTGIVKTTDDIVDQEVVRPIRKDSQQDPGVTRLRMTNTLMSGADVKSARAAFESSEGWVVHLTFTGEGFDKFNQIAAQYVGQQIAIVLDGVVISYPVIREAKFDQNDVVISGNFKEGEAKDLALVLKYGALPVALERQTVQDVSPSLGKDQLHAGIFAGILGLTFVAIYMVLYYRLLGLVVISGLLLVAGFLYIITCWLGSAVGLTLTLSGVVGIIVSAGTTVDSYIVYFERLKDEVRSGKTIRSSLDRGFARSFRTILAGNLVSLIGAALLYFLAIGSVRGFAFFLLITTILDIIVAYFFMHPLVSILGRKESFTKARWLGIASGLGVKGATA